MNYIIKNDGTYETIDGYVFKTKTGSIAKGLKLAPNDSIENYEIIEEPVEEITEENPTYEELLEMYNKQTLENSENQGI